MYSSKEYLIAFILAIIVAFILWYRNKNFDRIFAGVIFLLGLIQLIIYSCYNGVSSKIAGNMIIVNIYIILLVFSICIFLYTRNSISLSLIIVSVVLLFSILYNIIGDKNKYRAYISKHNNLPVWISSNGFDDKCNIFGWQLYIYISIIVIAWIILLFYADKFNVILYSISLYIIIILIYISSKYGHVQMIPIFSYLLLGGLIAIIVLAGFFD